MMSGPTKPTGTTKARPRAGVFGVWLCAFYAVWVAIVWAGSHWALLGANSGIAAAMAVGSYFAGSTPMGGGTVGFPVLVLLFDHPAALGRDFSLAIQSVGMVSASILIWRLRQPVEGRILKWSVLGSLVGTPLGLAFVAPIVPGLYVKLAFAVLWASFGTLHFAKIREISRMEGMTEMPASFDRLAGVLVGFFAGLTIVATAGVGVDVLLYIVLVLLSRADMKIAVPTSVVIMAVSSVIGISTRLALASVDPGRYALAEGLFGAWLAASPVVLIGAPVGVLMVRLVPRAFTLMLVSALCVLQFGWTLWDERASLDGVILGLTAVAFLVLNLAFMLMYDTGKRWAGRRGHTETPPGSQSG